MIRLYKVNTNVTKTSQPPPESRFATRQASGGGDEIERLIVLVANNDAEERLEVLNS